MDLAINIFLGLVAIGLAIVAVIQARKRKPVWGYRTNKIIGLGTDAPTELKLLFNNKQILDVYRTELIFFNRGNLSIREDDISDSIIFVFKGADFLRDPYAMKINRHESRIGITTIDSHKFQIDFKFLDHKDGALIEILHTKYEGIECLGNVIDAGLPKYIGEFKPERPEKFFGNVIIGGLLLLFPIWLICDMFIKQVNKVPIEWDAILGIVTFTILYVLALLASKPNRFFRYLIFPVWSRATSKDKL